MKVINPLEDMQTSYTKENLIRYIDTNNFIETSLSNNKSLLYIFQESEQVLGYVISPAYIVHYYTILQTLTRNNSLSFARQTDDFITQEVYSNYYEYLFLKKECEKINQHSFDVKSYDIFISFNDYTLNKEKIISFLRQNISYFDEPKCMLNIINVDKILKKQFKNLTVSQFKDLELLLATMKKTLPTFFRMSQHDLFFKTITKNIKEIHEQLCVFCQDVITISSDDFKEILSTDKLNNEVTNKALEINNEVLGVNKIDNKLKFVDKINNVKVIKDIVLLEQCQKDIIYNFEAIAREVFPEKKIHVSYIDEDSLTTHLYLQEENISKERIFFNIREDMILNQYQKKTKKRTFKKKENVNKNKQREKHD